MLSNLEKVAGSTRRELEKLNATSDNSAETEKFNTEIKTTRFSVRVSTPRDTYTYLEYL